jgi:hypothetical protein
MASGVLVEYFDVKPFIGTAESQNISLVIHFHTTVLELILEPENLGIVIFWIHDASMIVADNCLGS